MSEERWKENTKEHEAMSADIATLKSDVSTLKFNVSTLKSDVSTLKSDVSTLKSDVSTLKSDVSTLKSDVAEIKEVTSDILGKISLLRRILIAIAGSIGFSLILLLVSGAWRLFSGH